MIILDTDILSMFAKIGEIELLKCLFSEKVAMVPRVRDEISIPLEYGYAFPLRVISEIRTVPLSKEALEEYEKLQRNFSLGRGELEAVAYCKTEDCAFATNDMKAREFAKGEGLFVISLQAILKAFWKKGIKDKEEVKRILENIKEADNLSISIEVEREIFDE